MATIDECRSALTQLITALAGSQQAQRTNGLDRSISCEIRDLDYAVHGRLHNGRIETLHDGADPEAHISLTLSSDDLVALTRGELDFAHAWLTRRIIIDASFLDLIRLKTLL